MVWPLDTGFNDDMPIVHWQVENSSVEKSSVTLQCVSQIISCKDFFFLSRAQLFKAGFGPAESLQGGLCLLASVQVLTGCIKGVVRSLSLSHKHTYRQTDIHTHTEAN